MLVKLQKTSVSITGTDNQLLNIPSTRNKLQYVI